MDQPYRLATFFLPQAPRSVTPPADPAALDALLRQAWEKGQTPWPRVALSAEAFVTHLAQSLTQAGLAGALGELLEHWHLADLYLACACMKENPIAREMLDTVYLSQLATWLGKHRIPTDKLDEIRQTLRINLLMGTPRSGPRLATYTGRGPLESWLRISASRVAIRLGGVPREPQEATPRALFEAIPAPQPDAEHILLLSRYGPRCMEAYRESLRELPDDQKVLLMMHFIERVPTTRLGALFGVDQSTIWRRIKSAQEAVHEATKQRLKDCLHLSSREFESLFDAIRSQLDASISQILEEDHEDDSQEEED